MSAVIQDLIQQRWNDEECPLFDGILFGDGDIVLMECRTHVRDSRLETIVRPLARSSLGSFLDYNPEGWVSITPMASFDGESGGLVVTCGEGAQGGDGFVAVCEADDQRLKWLAFFQGSNPFKRVTVEHDRVVAVSTHDHVWTFPLDRPELVSVDSQLLAGP